MEEHEKLEQAIAHLEAQRATLGDAVVEAALAPLREKLAVLQPLPDSQQRKQVTILFADVSGFTAMSETIDAEEVSETMNALWVRLDAAIIQYGGTIDKHIGDAVMALFGAPTAREDDPERAIRAALAMQAELAALRQEWQVTLAMRIGINTGPVLLGEVGTTAEYTAMGDTVNLASRLEHAAPVGQILISHETYRHVRGVFDVQVLDSLSVKGKRKPVQVYLVQRAKARAFRLGMRVVGGIETRMVGREAELERLQEVLNATMRNAETQLVTIVGEAGIGKSRLLYEFRNWLELLPERVWIFNGRATPEMSKLPYALIRELFTFRFEIRDSDPAGVARRKLEQGIAKFMGVDNKPEMKAHFIGHLLGFDFSDSPHLQVTLDDPRQIHDRAFEYVTQFFKAVAEDDPVVIYLDSLHWADDNSLDLIDHLARTCREVPLFIVGLTRPLLFRRRPSWSERWASHTRLELHSLSEENCHQFVQEILAKMPDIPSALSNLLVSRAEGNPFYLEELTKMLIDEGIIVTGADQWQVGLERLGRLSVPPTLTAVLQARLDRLSSPEREILQRASVVGRIFWDSVVAHLGTELDVSSSKSDNGKGDVVAILGALQKKEFVFKQDTSTFAGAQEYIFKNAILHEVTYESVLKRLRRRYHAWVARWLIGQNGEQVEEYAGLIGEHYERAGETVQAIEWYGQAGKRAQATYANQAALRWYNETLDMLDRLGPEEAAPFQSLRLSVYISMGEILTLVGQYDEALGHYASAQGLLEAKPPSTDQRYRLAELCRTIAEVHERRSKYKVAFMWLEKGLDYLDDDKPTIEAARIYNRGALIHRRQGKNEEAMEWCQRSLAIASQIKTREGEQAVAYTYYNLGDIYRRRGDLAQAIQYCQKSLQIYQQIDDVAGQVNAYNNMGIAYRDQGDWVQASNAYAQSLAIAQEIGDIQRQGFLTNNLGIIHLDRGEWGQAAGLFEQSYVVWKQVGAVLGEAVVLSNLAQVHIYQENWAEVRTYLSRSQDLFTEIGSEEYLPELERRWGEFYLKTGELNPAMTHTGRSIALAVEQGDLLEEGVSRRMLGQVHLARGEWDLAEAELRQSLQILSDLDSEYEAAKTRLALASLMSESGNLEEAQAYLHQATETFEKLGAKADLAAARELAQRYGMGKSQ